MQIRKSAEDYLEAILVLSKQGGGVRSIDIATMLGVSKPSVSHAMKLLRHIYERHTVLSKMLEHLGVSPEVAKEDACKLEHDLSDESFTRIKEHFHKVIGEVE